MSTFNNNQKKKKHAMSKRGNCKAVTGCKNWPAAAKAAKCLGKGRA